MRGLSSEISIPKAARTTAGSGILFSQGTIIQTFLSISATSVLLYTGVASSGE